MAAGAGKGTGMCQGHRASCHGAATSVHLSRQPLLRLKEQKTFPGAETLELGPWRALKTEAPALSSPFCSPGRRQGAQPAVGGAAP